jgi:DNA modification methylase
MAQSGALFYGDNLDVLRRHVDDESVDLVYLDPPFNSNADYNILFGHVDGSRAAAQIKAFGDTWRWDEAAAADFQKAVEHGGTVADALRAFQTLLGGSNMLAYLSMMAPRLIELRRVLKSTGSLFLHCDPTASHYLKLLLDSIFSPENFRNEIIWRRTGAHGPRRSFGPVHDTLLFYSKSKDYYFNVLRRPYMAGHVAKRYRREPNGRLRSTTGGNILTGAGTTNGESGQPWRGFNPSSKGRHWAIPGDLAEQMPPEFQELGVQKKLDALYDAGLIEIKEGAGWPHPVRYLRPGDGQPLSDLWASQPYTGAWGTGVRGTVYETNQDIDADVQWLGRTDPERLGYPTQKPEGLLQRVIESSCPPDGSVLDPFCGCGTAVAVAERLERRWVGIDITFLATNLIKSRLVHSFGEDVDFKVIGEPTTVEDAAQLARNDHEQFEAWALGLVGARTTKKKGADRGIDGRLPFLEKLGGKARQVVISVKGGRTGVGAVRDLRGVIEREQAEIGLLISMREPTRPMREEAVNAGFYRSGSEGVGSWGKHPRMQLLTVEELLSGKRIDMPRLTGSLAFRRAQKIERRRPTTEPLFENFPDTPTRKA